MKEYITRDKCNELLVKHGDGADGFHKFANAAIQAYRDSLMAGVVLPELPDPDYLGADGVGDIFGYEERHMQDYARQAIADALCVAEKETAELRLYKHNMEARFKGLNSMLADALAKQVTRAPMFEFRECEDSQAAAPELKTNNLAATVFVYRNRVTSEINCVYVEGAKDLESSPVWEHLATLEPRLWIQAHYEKVMTLDPKEAV